MSFHEEGSDSEKIEMDLLQEEGSARTSEQKRWKPSDFKKRECNTFIEDSSSDGRCQCGHRRNTHRSPHINTAVDTEWTSELHSSEWPTDAFGKLDSEGDNVDFLRLSSDTDPSVVYDLMTRDNKDDGWGRSPPDMVVSVVGGEGSAGVKTWVQKVIRQELVKALDKTGGTTWMLTEGFDEGVGRCVGEAMRDNKRVCVLGITPWGAVHNRHQLIKKDYVRYSVANKTSDSCCLEDMNHDVFLLVDDGSEGHRGGEKNFRLKLEKYSSSIHIPGLNMLISGEPSILESVCESLKNSRRWLVLAGSGGVADLLSDILENQSPASAGVDVARVTEVIGKHFPSENQTAQLVKQVQSIYQNRNLITFYHEEQERPEDFDTVMIKALMPASTRCASGTFPYSKELSLAVRWNRVDLASELFNDDISNDDFLTNGVLEELYSRVPKDTLVYKELLECLRERLGKPDHDSLKEISLFEVSGVLKKLMGEVKPFYLTVLGIEDFTSDKKALECAKKLLNGGCSYRNQPCKSPWVHLFIWAVLQNSGWAVYFWEKEEKESVLNALSACKMLREMSKMEYGTKTKCSMKELAQKFEHLAHDVLGSCCHSDEKKSFRLLDTVTESSVWGINCFQMAISAKSLLFFNHDGLESVLSEVWWGSLGRASNVGDYLLSLLFPCSAPVSIFVSNAVMYTLFLFLFAYMLLVDFKPPPPSGPSISEYVLYFWVFTFFCEEIRQAFSVGYQYMTFCQKMRLYWKDFWNRCDLIAIILFIIGVICRMFEWSYESGRCVLCIDYMVFTLRLIHISAIRKDMGPKIIIVGKMMKDVASFIFFMAVWIVAYGVASQALLYSYDPNPSRILRRVFYRPYLYIFGEFQLEEIDVGQEWDVTCTNNVTEIEGGAEPCRSYDNNWLVIVLVVIFLLVTHILLINLLIAILSNTVNKVEDESELYWRAQHYNLVLEYQTCPVWAPPFIIFSHLGSLFRNLVHRWCCGDDYSGFWDGDWDCSGQDFKMKNGTTEEVTKWEMDQKKNVLTAQSETERSSDSGRIKQISDKVDKQQTDFDQRQRALETKVEACSDALGQILDLLAKAPWTKPLST